MWTKTSFSIVKALFVFSEMPVRILERPHTTLLSISHQDTSMQEVFEDIWMTVATDERVLKSGLGWRLAHNNQYTVDFERTKNQPVWRVTLVDPTQICLEHFDGCVEGDTEWITHDTVDKLKQALLQKMLN